MINAVLFENLSLSSMIAPVAVIFAVGVALLIAASAITKNK